MDRFVFPTHVRLIMKGGLGGGTKQTTITRRLQAVNKTEDGPAIAESTAAVAL